MSQQASGCLVAGSLNVDLIGRADRLAARDEEVRLATPMLVPGGHAGNCAVAMARLDAPVRLLACVGRDSLGTLALAGLREARVDVSFVSSTTQASTGVVFIPVLPNGDRALYMARGANEYLDGARLSSAAQSCTLVVIFDPPVRLLPELAQAMRGRTSVFAPGGLAAAPPDVLAPLLEATHYLILNGPESRDMTGLDDPAAAAANLARRWQVHAIITVGPDGCWIADPTGGVARQPSFQVAVADTTGAGDAFVAGFCCALLRGEPPMQAARLGCAVGALATRALGAQASLPSLAEVESLLASSRIDPDGSAAAAPRLAYGADGWRGIIGEGFSVETVADLAAAIGEELRERAGSGSVLVAHDARHGSAEAAAKATAVLSSVGLRASLAGRLPTPLATFAVRDRGLTGALLVTASHNPSRWNGVKLKVAPGMPPDRELEAAIERRRGSSRKPVQGTEGAVEPLDAAALRRDYVSSVLRLVDTAAIRRSGFRVAVDGLEGVAGGLLAELLVAAGCSVGTVGGRDDPDFAGLVPDPTRPASRQRLSEAVVRAGADLGLLTDGDGDRLGVLDASGALVWPHDLLALLLPLCDRLDPGRAAVATTVACGSIVGQAAARLGRETIETPVGFKHMAPLLRSGQAFFGGGGVGDVGFRIHGCDRDPNLAALLLLQVMAEAGQPLDQLVATLHSRFGEHRFREATILEDGWEAALPDLARRSVGIAGLAGSITGVERVDGVKVRLGETGWLLVRAATTERGLRVTAEAQTDDQVCRLIRGVETSVQEGVG